MNLKTPKISVLVITYNQEKEISRAIDSILKQKEYVHEVIIGEDCSKDGTRGVVDSYRIKFPEIVKPIYNDVNLGIFGNMENLYDKPSGDCVFWLSGDDVFCDGIFERFIEKIQSENIDFQNDLFAIYFDTRIVYPNGLSKLWSNNLVNASHDIVSLKIRNLIHIRGTGYSVKLLALTKPVRKDIGIGADFLIDIQIPLLTKKNYYVPFVGSVYYAGVGVSIKQDVYDYYITYKNAFKIFLEENKVDFKDKMYLRFSMMKSLFRHQSSIKNFFLMFFFYFMSFKFSIGVRGSQLDKLIENIKRKLL